jgi:hypothetical protein
MQSIKMHFLAPRSPVNLRALCEHGELWKSEHSTWKMHVWLLQVAVAAFLYRQFDPYFGLYSVKNSEICFSIA